MTQADRDRLVTLRKAHKKLITRQEAAEELGLTVRHLKRLVKGFKGRGDKVVIHGLRGKPSARRIDEKIQREAVKILSADVYRGFGPTLAAEYLSNKHGIEASKETVRKWMIEGKLWRAHAQKVVEVHQWRPRRSRFGELVQWDTSEHDWLEGRGEKIYLIAMIDDATSRLFARFVRQDTVAENMRLLWSYLEKFGRPVAFYTDKAALFKSTPKIARDEKELARDEREPLPPTQIGRALGELGIALVPAHSPQAKGRVERNFGIAQDRLVKGMRVAGVKTIERANQYLLEDYLVWWERELTRDPASPEDAHRPLGESHHLAASLSHVERRQVRDDYTLRWAGKLYQIERQAITSGLRRANVRVEQRLDSTLAVRYGDGYLPVKQCLVAEKPKPAVAAKPAKPQGPRQRGSDWNKDFDLHKAPKVWQAARESGYRKGEAL